MKKLLQKVQKLSEIRAEINTIEESAREMTSSLKEKKSMLQEQIIVDMKKLEILSAKSKDGTSYSVSVRKGFNITSEAHARKWAKENDAFNIDKVLMKQKLSNVEELPSGFERSNTEYISIRKPKEDINKIIK